MSGTDTQDYMGTVNRPAFAVPGSPFSVASSASISETITLDTTIHTLQLMLAKVQGTITFSVDGTDTGYLYFGQSTTVKDTMVYIQVSGAFDSSVEVKVAASSGGSCEAYIGKASDPLSLSIANTVTTTGVVTVSNTVDISGAVTATFPNAQDVNLASQSSTLEIGGNTNSTVVNEYVSSNPTVTWPLTTFDVSSLAPGGTMLLGVGGDVAYMGAYDEMWILVETTGGNVASYSFELQVLDYQQFGFTYGTGLPIPFTKNGGNDNLYSSDPITIPNNNPFNGFQIKLTNTGTSTVTSDTIKLLAFTKYSSSNISNSSVPTTVGNPTTTPVNNRGVPGGHNAASNASLPSSTDTSLGGSANITATRFTITFFNGGSTAFSDLVRAFIVINGATAIVIPLGGLAAGKFSVPYSFDWGEGFTTDSNGIQVNPNADMYAYASITTKN